ncbi:succinate dehydrogenase, hydrophobic membrane anchor protein [Marinicella meishanensis]|uniref:succinate dehydrogenase, hydrophobic membrane anchor protein n=1 Tax=Marinicella meishanensis TaxID=2873263 RepID=UPI001CBAA784|nr:succinate dehydrogenase, hydrophobic membrane anchor protein [Marinicella sp. NBU2979]
MSFQSDMAKAKGLGSAKHGFGHWWMQRMSAVLLIPTGLYLLFGLASLEVISAANVQAWLSHPIQAGITLLFVVTGSYHGALGIQVVLEDYVHHHALNLTLQYLTKILMIVMIMAGVFAIFTLLFG